MHEKQLIKSSREKDSLKLLKQKQIFDELVNETRFEINKSNERTDFNNLTFYYTGKGVVKYFVRFEDPLFINNDIKNGQASLQKKKKNQKEFPLK